MTVWTVLFGDDPLKIKGSTCVTTRVKTFDHRRTAYAFRDLCKVYGVYADVHCHTSVSSSSTLH